VATETDRQAGDPRARLRRRLATSAVVIGCVALAVVVLAVVVRHPHHARDRGWDDTGGRSVPGADWRPYSSRSPFNQRVAGAQAVPNSQAMVGAVLRMWGSPAPLYAGTADTSEDFGHPTFYATPNDPIYTLHATNGAARSIEGKRVPIPADARPAAGGDAHMTIVTPDGWEYDFWQVQSRPAGGGVLRYHGGGRTRIDGNGLGSGGTASGFGNLAGIIRAPELASGHIDHALFIVLRCTSNDTSFGYGTHASAPQTGDGAYVYPADHGGSSCGNDPNLPPLGARFVLNMTAGQIQALNVPTWKQTILTALAQYGGYVGDTGGPGFGFEFESSTTYTALGEPDPLVAFARRHNVPFEQGKYVFNLSAGVDWGRYLRIVAPPSRP
jgi:hypothetical protein